MVTMIDLRRDSLITKEKMELVCKGESSSISRYTPKDSVNDDLESLFENIRLGKELNEDVKTYFLPKLTKEELEWVERKKYSYLVTFSRMHDPLYRNPDVDETEMMLSESDSKYICALSSRSTFVIENSSEKSLKNDCALQ